MNIPRIIAADPAHLRFLKRRAIEWLNHLPDAEAMRLSWDELLTHCVDFLDS